MIVDREIDPLAESDLLVRARAGDREALAVLYQAHAGPLLDFARATDPQHAEDLVAEAFTATWRRILAGGGPPEHLGAYLRAAVASRYRSRCRTAARTRLIAEFEESTAPRRGPHRRHPSAAPADQQVSLEALPRRWRRVLIARYIDDRPWSEVAADLGISIPAAQRLAFRARRALRTSLGDLEQVA